MGVVAPFIPLLAAGAGAVGTLISANAARTNLEAQAASANYQSQVAANNAIIQKQNADSASRSGAAKESQLGLEERAKQASVKAAMAAGGIDVNTGSAADVESAGTSLALLDEQTLGANTAREVYGYNVAATGQTAESTLLAQQSNYASSAAGPAYFGSILSGASSVGSNYAKSQNVGAGNFTFTG